MSETKPRKPVPLNPNQFNTFWRSCIEKEEAVYSDGKARDYNIISHASSTIPARVDHLRGAGAIMGTPDADPKKGFNPETGSLASVRSAKNSTAGSQAGSKASKAGSSAEIMNRLATLEKELKAERERRQAAETQMLSLLSKPDDA